MRKTRSFLFSTFASWGLTASGGLLAVVGVIAAFTPASALSPDTARGLCVLGFAGLMGFSVTCGNCTASAAAHAIDRGRFVGTVFWPAAVCTMGFVGLSAIGIHLGWAILAHGAALGALPADWMVNTAGAFAALAKPAMSWIIQGRKSIDADDAEERERKEEARMESARARDREAAWSRDDRPRANGLHHTGAASKEPVRGANSDFGAPEHQSLTPTGREPTGAQQPQAGRADGDKPRQQDTVGASSKGAAPRRKSRMDPIASSVGLALAATIVSGGAPHAPAPPPHDLAGHAMGALRESNFNTGPSDPAEVASTDPTSDPASTELLLRGTGAWSALGGTDARVLSRRERRDLALGLRGAMRPDAIGTALRVDRSTVYRWFQKADQQNEIAGA